MGKSQLKPTKEERHAYQIIKGLVSGVVDLDRVILKRRQRWATIFLDNQSKCICWLSFTTKGKIIMLPLPGGIKHVPLDDIEDLVKVHYRLQAIVRRHEQSKKAR